MASPRKRDVPPPPIRIPSPSEAAELLSAESSGDRPSPGIPFAREQPPKLQWIDFRIKGARPTNEDASTDAPSSADTDSGDQDGTNRSWNKFCTWKKKKQRKDDDDKPVLSTYKSTPSLTQLSAPPGDEGAAPTLPPPPTLHKYKSTPNLKHPRSRPRRPLLDLTKELDLPIPVHAPVLAPVPIASRPLAYEGRYRLLPRTSSSAALDADADMEMGEETRTRCRRRGMIFEVSPFSELEAGGEMEESAEPVSDQDTFEPTEEDRSTISETSAVHSTVYFNFDTLRCSWGSVQGREAAEGLVVDVEEDEEECADAPEGSLHDGSRSADSEDGGEQTDTDTEPDEDDTQTIVRTSSSSTAASSDPESDSTLGSGSETEEQQDQDKMYDEVLNEVIQHPTSVYKPLQPKQIPYGRRLRKSSSVSRSPLLSPVPEERPPMPPPPLLPQPQHRGPTFTYPTPIRTPWTPRPKVRPEDIPPRADDLMFVDPRPAPVPGEGVEVPYLVLRRGAGAGGRKREVVYRRAHFGGHF